jgi:hypothetical protein
MKILANPDEMAALLEALTADNMRLRAENDRMSRDLGDLQMEKAGRGGLLLSDPECVSCGLKKSQESSVYARSVFGGEVRCNDCAAGIKR